MLPDRRPRPQEAAEGPRRGDLHPPSSDDEMTRLLHTADLHLAEDHPERWEALEAVREAAREHGADAVVVAGDLLDRASDHATLRARVRERLGAFPCDVLVLPGNHDRGAYRPGQDWSSRARLMLSEPVHSERVGDVELLAVPYPAEATSFARLRRHVEERAAALREREPETPVVLVLHGTLMDARDPHIQEEAAEDEPEDPYFPVRTGELEGLGLAYVALGHYHQPDLRRVGSLPVAYAGSPSPVGSHAFGPRSAMLVELEGADEGSGGGGERDGGGARVEAVRLPVPYREELSLWLPPFEEEVGLERLEAELEERADPRCSLEVELEGILAGLDEAELRERADELRDRWAPRFAGLEIASAGVGLEPGRAELFRDFCRRLEEREEAGRPELRQRTLEIAARALKG